MSTLAWWLLYNQSHRSKCLAACLQQQRKQHERTMFIQQDIDALVVSHAAAGAIPTHCSNTSAVTILCLALAATASTLHNCMIRYPPLVMPATAVPVLTPSCRHSDSCPLLLPAVSTQVLLAASAASHSPSKRQTPPTLLPRLPLRLDVMALSALSQSALARPLAIHAALKAVATVSAESAAAGLVSLKLSRHLWHV